VAARRLARLHHPPRRGPPLHIVYRTVKDQAGVDYLVHHPDWDQADPIARDDGHFLGPGLSWAELVAAADNALPGRTTPDSQASLLLLLPALGDNSIPEHAVSRLAAVLSARLGAEAPQALAAALLDSQGPAGPARWATAHGDVRINDGRYSVRNPASHFALAHDRLARVSAALTP